MNQKISIGRIVHAVIKDARGQLITRPAIISRHWENTNTVQATVFPDSANDGLGDVCGKSSLQYDDTGIAENSWHWPVIELPLTAKLESRPAVDWVPLHTAALELCYAVEKLPASEQATNLSIQASALAARIQKLSFPQT